MKKDHFTLDEMKRQTEIFGVGWLDVATQFVIRLLFLEQPMG